MPQPRASQSLKVPFAVTDQIGEPVCQVQRRCQFLAAGTGRIESPFARRGFTFFRAANPLERQLFRRRSRHRSGLGRVDPFTLFSRPHRVARDMPPYAAIRASETYLRQLPVQLNSVCIAFGKAGVDPFSMRVQSLSARASRIPVGHVSHRR